MRYRRPRTISEATELLATDSGWILVAGATDVYPSSVGRQVDAGMIDLTMVEELRGIAQHDETWRIGACTTWTDIANAALPEQFYALQQAAVQIGGLQVQNRGTVGGNLCTASPAGDSIPVLMAMSAEIEIVGEAGRRILPIEDFITGYRSTALGPNEFIASVEVPVRTGASNFQKLGSRSHLVISIAMVATHIEAGPTPTVRVAVGACSPVARRIRALETLLGKEIAPVVAASYQYPELEPIGDVRASAGYRREVVAPLVARSIEACMEART